MSVVLAAAASCYKDNGNYDYTTEPTAITIDEAMRSNKIDPSKEPFVFKLGEPIEIPAKYTINDPLLKPENISIEWYFGAELVASGETLTLENRPLGRYTGMLVITDLRYDQKYTSEYSFQVEGTYSNGWAIVSEKSGASILSYLEMDSNTGEYKFNEDVYAKSNEGASLPVGIRGASYHMFQTYPQVFALSLALPGDGAIDVDCNSMSVLGNANREFINLPDNIEFKDVSYMTSPMAGGSVYALTTDGKLYVREEAALESGNVVPHAGIYPSLPLATADGYEITHWINTAKVSVMFTGVEHLIAFDKKNSRCVVLKNNKFIPITDDFFTNNPEPNRRGYGFDGKNHYEDIVFPDPHNLSGYEVKAMYGTGLLADFMTGPLTVCMILEKDGKSYFYSFTYYDSWGSVDGDRDLFFPIPDDIGFDVETMISCDLLGGPDPVLYFTANGNKDLYFINATNGTMKKIYTSESKITGFGPGEVYNMMYMFTPYYENFIIGTEDGNMKVVKMDNAARAQGVSEILYEINPGVGEIKYVRFMGNAQWSM